MGWQDLLQVKDETKVSPWVGGNSLREGSRTWTIRGKLPEEFGWYTFGLDGRKAKIKGPAEALPESLKHLTRGYLVGDRLIPDDVWVNPDPSKITEHSETVHLLEPGLNRFARVVAGRVHESGPLIYQGQEMPLGPEDDVQQAFEDDQISLDKIKGVHPALDAAFRMESWGRKEAVRRRAEQARLEREERERQEKEARRAHLIEQLGDGAGRRAMAVLDFGEAAKAALAVGGALYLDHRASTNYGEMVVKFRFLNRRFECTCNGRTLQIIDSGICLKDHETGEAGDTYFTLESLPGVIQEADREDKLVVYRTVR